MIANNADGWLKQAVHCCAHPNRVCSKAVTPPIFLPHSSGRTKKRDRAQVFV
jgi:hypothetical protein